MGTSWLQEYSSFNMHAIQSKMVKGSRRSSILTDNSSLSNQGDRKSMLTTAHSFDTMTEHMKNLTELFEQTLTQNFNIHVFAQDIGRSHALPYLITHLLDSVPLFYERDNSQTINYQKLVLFLNQIQKGYRKSVSYHNDLHGADVAQFMFLLFNEAQLSQVADLNYFDIVCSIIAATCHDFDHDGFNNAFHVNSMSKRALRYHDESVQENYHAAESISIMLDPKFNFLEGLSRDEIKTFRKRMVGLILSTDMAKHMQDLTQFKNRCENKQIKMEDKNGSLFIDKSTPDTLFETQQQLLEIAIHASDLSYSTRHFGIVKTWVYLLFEEFFN